VSEKRTERRKPFHLPHDLSAPLSSTWEAAMEGVLEENGSRGGLLGKNYCGRKGGTSANNAVREKKQLRASCWESCKKWMGRSIGPHKYK